MVTPVKSVTTSVINAGHVGLHVIRLIWFLLLYQKTECFSKKFSKHIHYRILIEFVQWESSCFMRTDSKDRCDEANRPISQLICEKCLKISSLYRRCTTLFGTTYRLRSLTSNCVWKSVFCYRRRKLRPAMCKKISSLHNVKTKPGCIIRRLEYRYLNGLLKLNHCRTEYWHQHWAGGACVFQSVPVKANVNLSLRKPQRHAAGTGIRLRSLLTSAPDGRWVASLPPPAAFTPREEMITLNKRLRGPQSRPGCCVLKKTVSPADIRNLERPASSLDTQPPIKNRIDVPDSGRSIVFGVMLQIWLTQRHVAPLQSAVQQTTTCCSSTTTFWHVSQSIQNVSLHSGISKRRTDNCTTLWTQQKTERKYLVRCQVLTA
jgi:hypothetical protein